MIKKKFNELVKKLALKKESVRPLITSAVITLFFFLGFHFFGNHFAEAMWIVNAILLGFLLLIIMFFAGFTVLKSLAAVGAELSLLVFLAQSYCDVPNRSISSNEALKSLLVFSLIYIIFAFGRSLYGALQENYKTVEKERWSKEKIGAVTIFLIFTILFIWEIYLVMSPIILNLCVYK